MFLDKIWGKKTEQTVEDLPLSTRSLCPECRETIEAQLVEENGQVLMYKTCPEHGEFREIISADRDFFMKMRRTHYERPAGLDRPQTKVEQGCPHDCGICGKHLPALFMRQGMSPRLRDMPQSSVFSFHGQH